MLKVNYRWSSIHAWSYHVLSDIRPHWYLISHQKWLSQVIKFCPKALCPQDAPTDACKYLQIEEFRCLNATWLLCYFYSLKSLEEDPERKLEAFWFEPRLTKHDGRIWKTFLFLVIWKLVRCYISLLFSWRTRNDMKPWVMQKQTQLNETTIAITTLPINWNSSCTLPGVAILKGNYSSKPQIFVGFR